MSLYGCTNVPVGRGGEDHGGRTEENRELSPVQFTPRDQDGGPSNSTISQENKGL